MHAASPQHPSVAVETTTTVSGRVKVMTRSDSASVKRKKSSSPKFKSRQDTISAALVRRGKSAPLSLHKIVRPDNPMYTVQVGTYTKAANALRNEKRAKERFKDQAVFDRYDAGDKLYRVSVGKFQTGKDASSFKQSMLKRYPLDYKECWIIYIAR